MRSTADWALLMVGYESDDLEGGSVAAEVLCWKKSSLSETKRQAKAHRDTKHSPAGSCKRNEPRPRPQSGTHEFERSHCQPVCECDPFPSFGRCPRHFPAERGNSAKSPSSGSESDHTALDVFPVRRELRGPLEHGFAHRKWADDGLVGSSSLGPHGCRERQRRRSDGSGRVVSQSQARPCRTDGRLRETRATHWFLDSPQARRGRGRDHRGPRTRLGSLQCP